MLERTSLVVMTGSTLLQVPGQLGEAAGARYLIKPMGAEDMDDLAAQLKRIFPGERGRCLG